MFVNQKKKILRVDRRYLRNKVGYQFVGWGKCFFEESEYNGIEFILQRWESFEELVHTHTFSIHMYI